VQLQRDATALKALLAQRLSEALDIPLGFSALDGD
jgi:predicted lipoprotein